MGSNIWPGCGCEVRCSKPACKKAGGRSIALSANQRSIATGPKYTPERLKAILNTIATKPAITRAAADNGITYSLLRNWLERSDKGVPGDGFDVDWGGVTKRFHLHFKDARDTGIQEIEDAIIERARVGWIEILSDRGRVVYQIDNELAKLGLTGPDAYLLDKNGNPIPEQISHQDPEIQMEVLRHLRRETWGRREQVDVSVRGGVMVVDSRLKNPAEIDKLEQAKLPPIDVDFREVEDE
jgi:hypothetical protein